jgi:chromate reductase, NAD(P)H dehydrogenase (quinone)
MPEKIKITAFAGSSRTGSYSKSFARCAVDAANSLGADAQFIDLRDYPLPLYDGDLEILQGLPENAKKLKKIFSESDAFVISTPEYNHSYSGLLKNTLDWVSRKGGPSDLRTHFQDKPVLTLSSSAGQFGGVRSLMLLRLLLADDMKLIVLPEQMPLPNAGDAFDENGRLKDEKKRAQLENNVKKLVLTAGKLKST